MQTANRKFILKAFVFATFLFFNPNLIITAQESCNSIVQPTLCSQFEHFSPQYTFSTPTSTSTLIFSEITNADILIDAVFTVNTPFSLTNCKIKFGANGKINLVAAGTLNSTASKYFGCNGWQGIEINATAILYFENNHV